MTNKGSLLYLLTIGVLVSISLSAAEPSDNKPWGTWFWGGGGREVDLGEGQSTVRGAYAWFPWSVLEPEDGNYDWKFVDTKLRYWTSKGVYLQVSVFVGPMSPEWLYKKGVPRVKTSQTINPRGESAKTEFPYYLNESYKKYYWRMIRAVSDHIDSLPELVRSHIIGVQTAEGSTEDEGPYKGSPSDKKYAISNDDWIAFKFETWKLFGELYNNKKPHVDLWTNSGNKGEYNDWLKENLPHIFRKAGNIGHGYQLSDEMDMYRFLDPLINHFDPEGNIIRARSEMDETHKGWFAEAPVWNMYWLNLWCLTFGLDELHQMTSSLKEPTFKEGFLFFNKYAGEKDPSTSPGAFCAFHDGLDASDTQRFSVEEFGKVAYRSTKESDGATGTDRALKIAKMFASFGAKQGDPEKGQAGGGPKGNRDAAKMNDVSYNIWADNYGRYLAQLDPLTTSQGWWRVGPPDQPYGRFARGFNIAQGKKTMYFDLNDLFFREGSSKLVSIRLVYFDQGKGSCRLMYDAGTPKQALEIKCAGTGRWKECIAKVEDGVFQNGLDRKADFILESMGDEDILFHMLEIIRN
jgi:hypothetical protein